MTQSSPSQPRTDFPRTPTNRDEMIERHTPLVRHILHRMAVKNMAGTLDAEDLFSYGMLGLIEAVDRYDASKGIPFAAYATRRIRGAIVDALRTMDPLSRTDRHKAKTLEGASEQLSKQLGREPTRAEVQQATGMTPVAYWDAYRASHQGRISLDALSAGPDDGEDMALQIASDDPAPSDGIEHSELLEELLVAIQDLPDRDRQVLGLRYQENLTLKEVAQVLGVSESRASQLHARIVERLRQALTRRGLAA